MDDLIAKLVVRIGSAHPLSRKRVYPPPGIKGAANNRLQMSGWADPIRMTGEKAWRSVYSVAELHLV